MTNKHNLKSSNLTGGNIDDIAKYHKSYGYCEKLKDNRYKKACHNASKNGQSYISSPSFGGYEIFNQKNKAITNKLIQKYNESKLAFMKSTTKSNNNKTKKLNTKTKKNKSKLSNSKTKRNKIK
jgi:hypothetical protein